MKRLVAFDLDGTLAPSKSPVDDEMVRLLDALLTVVRVAVISGGDWAQFQTQVLSRGLDAEHLGNLSILPTSGTKFYRHRSGWEKLYSEDLTDTQRQTIVAALKKAMDASGFAPDRVWGEAIEDRGTQITLSALGQHAPLNEKERWDPDFRKRKAIQASLEELIPAFSVRLGGTTSIDVTRPGIDKAYGLQKLQEVLGIDEADMLFIGDAIFPGGNDYAAQQAGVSSIEVRDPEQTKLAITVILACLGAGPPAGPVQGA